ncbi:MAG: AEC family transporter [Cyanobacteria bacterium J069]|nr:MAG: AEC family transporter [Cyanobacteria bacterium J069]
MSETLLHAYWPLIFWTGLGLLSFSLLPDSLPRLLGRGLYWVGVPVQIFTLARQTNFAAQVGLAPLVVGLALIGGIGLAWSTLQLMQWVEGRSPLPAAAATPIAPESAGELGLFASTGALAPGSTDPASPVWADSARRGSFLIAATLGNTGFVGLAIAPSLVAEPYQGWLVFYSITQNVLGTYGLGVWLASVYGRSHGGKRWWVHLRDVLTVPSLWAFGLGMLTRAMALPSFVDFALHASLWVIIPCALLLMGLRLRQIHGWRSLRLAIAPALLRVLVLPVGVAGVAAMLGLSSEPRLALVLMSGMPTAFAGLILGEEYDLDRELIASSIVLTTAALLLTLPLWLLIFS